MKRKAGKKIFIWVIAVLLLVIILGYIYLFTGSKIENVSADEKYLGDDGEIDLNKFTPITYDPVHHGYY